MYTPKMFYIKKSFSNAASLMFLFQIILNSSGSVPWLGSQSWTQFDLLCVSNLTSNGHGQTHYPLNTSESLL